MVNYPVKPLENRQVIDARALCQCITATYHVMQRPWNNIFDKCI